MHNGFSWLVMVLCVVSAPAFAAPATYPNRPITIMMSASAGGITDVAVRAYAAAVTKELGQQILVENRPDATGVTAAEKVQNAAPDGYTLLAFSGAQHASMPAIRHVPYEPVKGFAPITTLFTLANFLAVPARSPAQSAMDLMRLGRAKAGGIVYGSSGVGTTSHLTAARMSLSTSTPVKIVHYAGAAPMIADLVAGKLDFTFVSYTVAKPFLEAGKLKLLAVDADERWPDQPNVPTLRQAGVDQPKVASWFALSAPPGTPAAIIQRLHDTFVSASRNPDVVRAVRGAGALITTSDTPENLKTMLEQEVAATAATVRALHLEEP